MGHQSPTGFRVESAQLKCISAGAQQQASQQSHHCLRLHCCCPQPSKRQPNRLSSWNRNAGSGPTDAPETPLCLPTLPLFKNKTKSPTPPSALQHPRHWGRTDGGGRTLHMPAVKRICQNTPNEPARPGETGLPQNAGKYFGNI